MPRKRLRLGECRNSYRFVMPRRLNLRDLDALVRLDMGPQANSFPHRHFAHPRGIPADARDVEKKRRGL
jgi:hypothetical protein